MKTAQTLLATCVALCLVAPEAQAADGILIAQKVTNGSTVTTHQTQIEKTRMRSEITQPGGRKQVIIFDGGAQVLRMIDDSNKSYTEMSKAEAEQIRAQMDSAMTMMQEQLKNLPPEQRARMESMMRGRMPGADRPKTDYKKVGTDKVGRWTCDKYEGTRSGEKVSELCTVAPSAMGFTPGDFEVTQQLATFFSSMMPQAVDGLFRIGATSAAPDSFSGIPVRMVTFANGAPGAVIEVTEATHQSFADTLFQVPAGYQKREFPGAGRGPGRGRGRQH
ncbi:MAG TPA: hypothetical protein VKD69_03135 [Vicinamibacterales bacterium]|nr:hypothetical protein [Vicinamibacterales bacterium]